MYQAVRIVIGAWYISQTLGGIQVSWDDDWKKYRVSMLDIEVFNFLFSLKGQVNG